MFSCMGRPKINVVNIYLITIRRLNNSISIRMIQVALPTELNNTPEKLLLMANHMQDSVFPPLE